MKVEAVQGKQDPLEWTEISGGSWNGGTTLEFLSPFLWRAPLLEMRRERRNSFPPRRERIPPLELGGGNGAPLDVGGLSCFLSNGDSMSGNILSCSQGVKHRLEVPEIRCD